MRATKLTYKAYDGSEWMRDVRKDIESSQCQSTTRDVVLEEITSVISSDNRQVRVSMPVEAIRERMPADLEEDEDKVDGQLSVGTGHGKHFCLQYLPIIPNRLRVTRNTFDENNRISISYLVSLGAGIGNDVRSITDYRLSIVLQNANLRKPHSELRYVCLAGQGLSENHLEAISIPKSANRQSKSILNYPRGGLTVAVGECSKNGDEPSQSGLVFEIDGWRASHFLEGVTCKDLVITPREGEESILS
ncbi:hypothetical protein EDD16DRAFT_1733543 [Pisolithus croceorrhizus]|nr:hypothetical protein EDD16DRAFT_1733543 [Pisolithus croceorrhizus]